MAKVDQAAVVPRVIMMVRHGDYSHTEAVNKGLTLLGQGQAVHAAKAFKQI